MRLVSVQASRPWPVRERWVPSWASVLQPLCVPTHAPLGWAPSGLASPPALLTSLAFTLAPKKHWHICLTSGSDFWGSCNEIHAYCVLGSILGTGDITIQKTEEHPCPHQVNILEVVVGCGRQ